MQEIISILFFILTMVGSISAQITDLNFRIYDAKGSKATVQQIIDAIGKSNAIF